MENFEIKENNTNDETLKEFSNIVGELKAALEPIVEYKQAKKRQIMPPDYKSRLKHPGINKNTLRSIRDATIQKYPQWGELITGMVESITPSIQWSLLTGHIVVTFKEQPEVLEKYWEFVQWTGLDKSNQLGVRCEAGAYNIFQALGYDPQISTPWKDRAKKADLLVNGIEVQVKSSTHKETDFIADISQHGMSLTIYINATHLDPVTAVPTSELVEHIRKQGIPINVRNTNESDDEGTMIVGDHDLHAHSRKPTLITGIAGRKEFTVITIEKILMNQQVGFVEKILTVLREHSVSFEHMPNGIDTLSIIIDSDEIFEKNDAIISGIKKAVSPDSIDVNYNLAMICTVGQGMAHTVGIAARLLSAVARAGVNVRMINQGSSEISIIIGVDMSDYETAVRVIYRAFVDDEDE